MQVQQPKKGLGVLTQSHNNWHGVGLAQITDKQRPNILSLTVTKRTGDHQTNKFPYSSQVRSMPKSVEKSPR